jgi:AcrR family transcriptional regulator
MEMHNEAVVKIEEANVKQRILSAATELFDCKGYDATSIQEICDKAQISKGGLFYHFKKKEDILVLIHETFINYVLEKAEEAIKMHKSPCAILKKLIIDLVCCVGEYKPYVSVFFTEWRFLAKRNNEIFLPIRKKRDKYESIMENTIKQGIEAGEFRSDLNHKIVAKAIFGMSDWLYQWYNPKGELPPEEIGEIFWNLVFNGLKAEKE